MTTVAIATGAGRGMGLLCARELARLADHVILRPHHDVCIHRRGWQLILHPDGTTEARSPDGRQVLRSHAPPSPQAA